MKVYIHKKTFEWFKEMKNEGRTVDVFISSFPKYIPESGTEKEFELIECQDDDFGGELISKQKVKDVIESWENHLSRHIGTGEIDDCEGKLHYVRLIKKELGLE